MIMGYAGRIAESKAASKSIREQAEIVTGAKCKNQRAGAGFEFSIAVGI